MLRLPTETAPWRLMQAEWLASKPKVTRHFQQFDSITRANHAASHRLGYHQRQAVGEYFYTNPFCPDIAYPTAKAAKIGWHREAVKLAFHQGLPVPEAVLDCYPDLRREKS